MIEITRAKFEALNKANFAKIEAVLQVCMQDAGVNKSKVDKVVLVGGSTRIPKVRDIVANWIGNKNKVDITMNADEAIAYGATILAAQMDGKTNVINL